MSLQHLLPPDGVKELLTEWPDKPQVYVRGNTGVDGITADWLWEHIRLGCVPPEEVRALKGDVPAVTAHAFSTHGRLDGDRLRSLYERGYTIRLGNLQRCMAVFGRISRGIQAETGYSNYVHAFMTAPGQQGLRHHWDQQMAVIVQLEGVKRWELWAPVVDAPMRTVNQSYAVWRPEWVDDWERRGPDQVVMLEPGQSLLLPRGWIHNPWVPADGEDSTHLTFAIRERTPYWLAEQLLGEAIKDPELRRVIRPGDLLGPDLPGRLDDVRQRLLDHLGRVDVAALAGQVSQNALTDLEYTT
ncbi:JmjC domain-containing protein [Streptomyces sp. NPDC001068]|uniref:JmjC domain-containing protein n=1 Tax=Streptomyces sp. NPDC001068 TaxID=3364544 RepID=UPI003693926B